MLAGANEHTREKKKGGGEEADDGCRVVGGRAFGGLGTRGGRLKRVETLGLKYRREIFLCGILPATSQRNECLGSFGEFICEILKSISFLVCKGNKML